MKKHTHNPEHWRKIFEGRIGNSPIKELLRFSNADYNFHNLINSLFPPKNYAILEYGAGSGFHSICFRIYGFRVVCTDIESSVVELINSTKKDLHIDFETGEFDIITEGVKRRNKSPLVTFSDGVLEHFTEKEIISALKNQKKADYVTFSVPTNRAKSDETSYGDENLHSVKKWLELSKKVYPNSKITIYPVSHNNLVFYAFRRIVPLSTSKQSKFGRFIGFFNRNLRSIENRLAGSVYVVIENK